VTFFRRFRDAAVCVALLALPFFFLRANLQNPAQMNTLDRTLLQVSAPIQFVATRLAGGVGSIIEEYVWLVDVKRDNDRLRSDNARLREWAQRMQAEIGENRNLRRLLQLREQHRGNLLSAQVIGKEISPYFRVLRLSLDRGEASHVRAGMPVLTADGLVGQVRRTWGSYSDVLLVADKNSAIDVVVQRTGARGILKGTGGQRDYACRIEHLAREDDVQVGDRVVTSGQGQRFPGAIVVGVINEVSKREYGLYQDASVKPAVNFSRLREVMVLASGPRGQSAPLAEKAE
jgi:rod shape-determining protein MreC